MPNTDSLLFQHAHADREMEVLRRAVRGDENVKEAFDAFEGEILGHFEAEERQLFPSYTREVPEDAATLREQHSRFRRRLEEARGLVEHGAFDARHLRDLQIALTLHHAHEETGLYRWARARQQPAAGSPPSPLGVQ